MAGDRKQTGNEYKDRLRFDESFIVITKNINCRERNPA